MPLLDGCDCATCRAADRMFGETLSTVDVPTYVTCTGCGSYLPQDTYSFYQYPNGRWSLRCKSCERDRRIERTRAKRASRPVAYRRYGVEIEALFEECDTEDIANALDNHGINAIADDWRSMHNSNCWTVTTDGSVMASEREGYELVSPPLKNPDGRRQIEVVCRAMRDLAVDTNSTCGLHVHHEVQDLDARAFGRLLRFYHDGQDAIDSLVSPSRRHNDGYTERLPESIVREVERMRTLERGTLDNWGRYYVLNPSSYPKYGTIEFRQHQGTTDPEKINRWVEFGQAMINWAKTERARYVNVRLDSVLDQLEQYGGLSRTTVEYYTARAQRLSRSYAHSYD